MLGRSDPSPGEHMKHRSSLLFGIVLALLMAFPVVDVTGGSGGAGDDGTPTRYGFTPTLYPQDITLSTEAICVDTGDFDGVNNDDIVIGQHGSIQLLKNNGASGSSFKMNVHQTITLSGWYITRIRFGDYDNDGDLDVIALGQEEYFMADEAGSGGPSIFSVRIFYIENSAGTFSVEDYEEFRNGYLFQDLWYWSESKFDMDVADVDGDNDLDTVFIYNVDTDGNANNGGEQVRLVLVTYASGSLSNSTLTTVTISGHMATFNEVVRFGDFDADDNPDIVYSYGGRDAGGAIIEASIFIRWHTGVGANWGSPVDLDPNDDLVQGGIFGSLPFAMAVGEFAGNSLPDIVLTNNRNGGTSPPFGDAGIYLIRALTGRDFSDPVSVFSQVGYFMIRGMDVGDFDKEGREDLVCFTKRDTTADPSPYDGIDDYSLSLLGSRQSVPYGFFALKVFETPTDIPFQVIKDVGVGNFDNDPDGYADMVYVGDKVTVGFTTFPPNNIPRKVREVVSPLPVYNDDRFATVNITVEDLDGAWDLAKIVVDFTPLGLPVVVVSEPEKDPSSSTIGWYEFEIQVPPTVRQGDYNIRFDMYDQCTDPPGRNAPKSNDTFLFRVKQYNRRPEIAIDEANRTLYLKEDTPTYFEGVYGWFRDLDIEEGYAPDYLNISMKSFQSNTFVTTSTLKDVNENVIFRADLKNGSAADPKNWSLLITPGKNFHHREGESNQLTLRAGDGLLYTDPLLVMNIVVLSVNDDPVIPPQGWPEDDFQFLLIQNERGTRNLKANDAADDPTGVQPLKFYFEYENEEDASWLVLEEDGTVTWDPKNDNVGPHMVTLWVSDGIANVSQVMWFNVSNVNDPPFFVSVSNQTTTVNINSRHVEERIEFIVREHEEFNLTIVVKDLDYEIGLQDSVGFKCNLTMLNNTYLDVDDVYPFTAHFHFWAEKRFGYYATYEPETPPIDTEIIVTDGINQDIMAVLPLRIRILNTNDPPVLVAIDKPEEGASFPILYNIEFSAGESLDPDTVYGDNLTYMWDFDASDGEFQAQFVGTNGRWDFPAAGTYMITLRVVDSAGLYIETTRNITVSGVRDDDDFDNDGMSNKWEDENGLDKYDPSDAQADADGDGLSNIAEFLNHTDPRRRDTDGDGSPDGIDFAPLDPTIYTEPKEEKGWLEKSGNIILLVVIILVVLVLLVVLLVFILIRSKKRAREEEEKRRKVEEMQRSMYEGQDIYANLPQTAAAAESAVPAAPETAQLPPQPEAGLDDIFGGAGTLPSIEGAPEGLPPAPSSTEGSVQAQGLPPPPASETPQAPPQVQVPESKGSEGDITKLLDE